MKKQGCSFVEYHWHIASWPDILKTKAGEIRRQEGRESKMASNVRLGRTPAPALTQTTSEGSGTTLLRRSTRGRKAGTSTQSTISKSATPEVANPSISSKPSFAFSHVSPGPRIAPGPSTHTGQTFDLWNHKDGRSEQIFFEALGRFEAVFADPNRSVTSIRTVLSELAAIEVREKGALAVVAGMVSLRKGIIDDLTMRLEVALRTEVAKLPEFAENRADLEGNNEDDEEEDLSTLD